MTKIKPIKALALIGKKKVIEPTWIIASKNKKEYILKEGEKWQDVEVRPITNNKK